MGHRAAASTHATLNTGKDMFATGRGFDFIQKTYHSYLHIITKLRRQQCNQLVDFLPPVLNCEGNTKEFPYENTGNQ